MLDNVIYDIKESNKHNKRKYIQLNLTESVKGKGL